MASAAQPSTKIKNHLCRNTVCLCGLPCALLVIFCCDLVPIPSILAIYRRFRQVLATFFMLKSPESEILAIFSPTWAKNAAKKWQKCSPHFRPLISRKSGRKKFHEKLATNSAGREIKFFHRETPGVWGHDFPHLSLAQLKFFFQKRPFVHNSVCSQFSECSQFCLRAFYSEFKRKSITSLFWEGEGVKGHENSKQTFCEKTGVS